MAVHDVSDETREKQRDGQDGTRRRRFANRRNVLVAAGLLLLAVAYLGAAWFVGDRVARGTTVAGVPVGGLTATAAQDRIEDSLADAATEPVTVVLGEKETDLDPQDAGLELDARATAATLTDFTLDPRALLAHLTGGREHAPQIRADDEALQDALLSAGESLEKAPVEGAIEFVDGEVEVTEAVVGLSLDADRAADPLLQDWLTTAEPIELPGYAVSPTITADAVDTALEQLVRPLTSGPIAVEAGDDEVELTVEDLLSLASVVSQDDALVLDVDEEEIRELVLERSPEVSTQATDARIVLRDGSPTVVAGSSGQDVDAEHLAAQVTEAAMSTDDRTAAVELVEVDPEFTTEQAEELGVKEAVASFDTPYFHDPDRTANLRRGAEKITNTLIKPGETFSLIDTLGPITVENGYSPAGVVLDGLETTGMGGGLSQVSTTTFNVAFFAGMELVEFQPHSHNYPRYPEGREATVYTPSVDLKWKNTTPYGALMQAWVADGSFHVRMWSTEHFEVSSHTSDRYNFTSPKTVRHSGSSCVPNSNPSRGFSVNVERTVSLDGEEVENRSWTTTYIPWDRVICE